jgi:16S rRNA (cytosine967-C5)-methyltransferase
MLPVSKEAGEPQAPAPVLPGQFGTILVDAPCSGLGTLARRPEIRLRRTPEDCEALAVLQKNILDAVWERLLPGGLLVYVTCTMNKAENQSQTAAFLERHSGAALEAEFETPAGSPLGEFFYSAKIRKRS